MISPEYLAAFALTLSVEVAVGFALGLRSLPEIGAVGAAQLITHPLLYAGALALGASYSLPSCLLMEAGAVVVEAAVLRYALPYKRFPEMLLVSLMMNLASFLAGAALFWRAAA